MYVWSGILGDEVPSYAAAERAMMHALRSNTYGPLRPLHIVEAHKALRAEEHRRTFEARQQVACPIGYSHRRFMAAAVAAIDAALASGQSISNAAFAGQNAGERAVGYSEPAAIEAATPAEIARAKRLFPGLAKAETK